MGLVTVVTGPIQEYLWEACQDETLLILVVCAIVSLIVGLTTEVFLKLHVLNLILANLNLVQKEMDLGSWMSTTTIRMYTTSASFRSHVQMSKWPTHQRTTCKFGTLEA